MTTDLIIYIYYKQRDFIKGRQNIDQYVYTLNLTKHVNNTKIEEIVFHCTCILATKLG